MLSKIEISHKTIIFLLLLFFGLWFLFQIKDILFLMFIAFIIMSALRPIIDFLEKKRVPRFVAIFLIYVVIFGFIGVSLAGVIPSFILQTTHLAQNFPSVVARVLPYWNFDFNSFSQQLAPIGENILKVTATIFSNIVTTMTVMVFSFYFLLERRQVDTFLAVFMGEEAAKTVGIVIERIEGKLGSWVQGQLILMVFIGVLVYVGLLLLRVEFALPLAILAGLFEIVPTIGPIVSAIPAIIVGLATSPVLAVSVVVLYIVVQQIENNIVVPFITKKSVGLPPLVTIVALMVGAKLAGIAGAILAVPVVLIIQEVMSAYFSLQQKS